MNKEMLLREARTTEAMRKGYMGLEGKFAVIARRLGSPIVSQAVENDSIMDFEPQSPENIPFMDVEEMTTELGLNYDGLSLGMNLSVTVYFLYREISCVYQGRKVYHEVGGELERFAPNEEWEALVAKIYDRAKRVESIRKPHEKKELVKDAERKRRKILEEYKEKWGLD